MPWVSAEGCQEISLEPDSPNDTAVSEFLQARQIKDYEGMSRALQKMKK